MASKAAPKESCKEQEVITGVRSEQRPSVSEHAVRDRAYELYLKRGCEHGLDLEDWLQAEQELIAEQAPSPRE